ncbi:MAG: hypothetical protein AAF841_11830 [Pseudomonadota bacterium]
MRALALSLFLALPVGAFADPVTRVFDALKINEVVDILAEEGRASAEELEENMFPGRGGAAWQAEIARIYDVGSMEKTLAGAMTRALRDADVLTMVDFLESARGKKIMALEISARRAFIDPEMEDIAAETFANAQQTRPVLYEQVQAFTEINALVEQNLEGAFASNAAFAMGLKSSGAFPGASADQLIAELWSGDEAVEADVRDWLFAYLMTAYAPLSEQDLAAYISFSETEPGAELNSAIMEGFGILFAEISFDLGAAAGRFMGQQDL